MKLSFFLLFFFSNIEHSTEVEKFKKQLQTFSEGVKETEKTLQQWREQTTPFCISSKLMQITVDDSAQKVGLLFLKNIEYLRAVTAFTNDKTIVTPRTHRRLVQDQYSARQLIGNYEKIYGPVACYARYTLKEKKCNQPGSVEISKKIIQVYKNFQSFVKLTQ